MQKYDYLIVGSGLFGATFAYRAKQAGKKCLVIERRPHPGGNVYCESFSPMETITSPTGGSGDRGPIIFGGRLAQYKYFDMAPIIEQVLNLKNF